MARSVSFSRTGSVVLLGLSLCLAARGQEVELTAEVLDRGLILGPEWLYLPAGDDTAAPPPDATWKRAEALLGGGRTPDDWRGVGWFAFDLLVAPEVAGELLGLGMSRHYGASRVYLGDRLLAITGAPAKEAALWQPEQRPDPIVFEAPAAGRHRLTVLFANPATDRFHRVGIPAGFNARLQWAPDAVARARTWQNTYAHRRALYTGVFLAFAVLHLLLFAFRPSSLSNLYFALFCLSLAALVFLLVHKELVADPRIVFWSEPAMNLAGLAFAAFGLLFVHRVFTDGTPRWLLGVLGLLLLVAPWTLLRPAQSLGFVFIAMLLCLLEMTRCVLVAIFRGKDGARIVGFGILTLLVGFGSGLLANLGVLPRVGALTFLAPFVSMLVLIVTMSIYLSRRYARTHAELEQQLQRVRELSQQQLAQERREREQELKTKLLEAEVERKAEELEEARRLQLSMLPQSVPEHPRVEIAAHMTTATEVGGDYYDFDVADDGDLTVAVGDATGHGLRAGTMVTATKSLFNALGGSDDMVDIVKRSNTALKRMNLRNLNMALLLARLRGNQLRVAAAGMPQPLICRAATGAVETLEIGGMPLGAMASFPYRAKTVEVQSGDAVLFMSDGFPERLNPRDEEVGYEVATQAFREAATGAAESIVERLVAVGERWAEGREADDDVTFVVLKVR
ncbi:MAG: SpoIIE family protein phosphatase [Acidobacteriota bacterium]